MGYRTKKIEGEAVRQIGEKVVETRRGRIGSSFERLKGHKSDRRGRKESGEKGKELKNWRE